MPCIHTIILVYSQSISPAIRCRQWCTCQSISCCARLPLNNNVSPHIPCAIAATSLQSFILQMSEYAEARAPHHHPAFWIPNVGSSSTLSTIQLNIIISYVSAALWAMDCQEHLSSKSSMACISFPKTPSFIAHIFITPSTKTPIHPR